LTNAERRQALLWRWKLSGVKKVGIKCRHKIFNLSTNFAGAKQIGVEQLNMRGFNIDEFMALVKQKHPDPDFMQRKL
jgi:hypothetical protein